MKWSDKIEVTNEDNMQLMSRYPDNYFELAIVDPPYGVGVFTSDGYTSKEGKRFKSNKLFHDSYAWNKSAPNDKYFKELKRISKNRIVWGSNYYPYVDGNGGSLVWYKGDTAKTVSHCEIASLSFQAKVDFVHIDWQSGFYRVRKEGIQIHPCQKPVKLYKWLLMNYAKEGDKILDTHLGSGSIALACHELGFSLTACELDSEYYDSALKRFKQQTAQLKLKI